MPFSNETERRKHRCVFISNYNLYKKKHSVDEIELETRQVACILIKKIFLQVILLAQLFISVLESLPFEVFFS